MILALSAAKAQTGVPVFIDPAFDALSKLEKMKKISSLMNDGKIPEDVGRTYNNYMMVGIWRENESMPLAKRLYYIETLTIKNAIDCSYFYTQLFRYPALELITGEISKISSPEERYLFLLNNYADSSQAMSRFPQEYTDIESYFCVYAGNQTKDLLRKDKDLKMLELIKKLEDRDLELYFVLDYLHELQDVKKFTYQQLMTEIKDLDNKGLVTKFAIGDLESVFTTLYVLKEDQVFRAAGANSDKKKQRLSQLKEEGFISLFSESEINRALGLQ
jgi:hypothetical protein